MNVLTCILSILDICVFVKTIASRDSAAISIRPSQDTAVRLNLAPDVGDRVTDLWVKEVQPTFSQSSTHLQPH